MKASAFAYARATSLADALDLLATHGDRAKVLSGGQSLMPAMNLRLISPELIVDIGELAELRGIAVKGDTLVIGALTRHVDLLKSPDIAKHAPLLAEAVSHVAHPAIRNRGTIGGSLAHADPSADYPAVMLAVDADIQLAGPKGSRTVRARDFFKGLFEVDLAAGEIITGVRFAPMRAAAYAKLRQRASHFAIVGVAAALDVDQGTIRSARVGLTGAASYATRLTKVEEALAGKALDKSTIDAAAALAGTDLTDVNADIHASEAYRRAMVPVFTRRALEGALARASASGS
jgi:carbon-monoxide dehydrogenase medium subunit